MPFRKLLSGVIVVFYFIPVMAQYNDAGLWLGVNLEKKITSSTSVTLQEELRMQENISQAGIIFTDIGISHKFNKYFSAAFNYRFIENRNLDASYSTRHRFYFDMTGKYKWRKITAMLRERVQSQVKDYHSSETGRIPVWLLRSKLTFKYDLDKKITPMVAVELYYTLNNPAGNELVNVRYYAGLDYEFNKRHSIQPYYLIQSEKHVNSPVTDFVIGLGYTFTF